MRCSRCWALPGAIRRWRSPWIPAGCHHIGNARGFMFDPSAHPVLEASPNAAETRVPSVVGKWGIDATKPVPYRAAERKNYERAWPIAWGDVKLEDYL